MLLIELPLVRTPGRDRVPLRRAGARRLPRGSDDPRRTRSGREYLFFRDNPKGPFAERWSHGGGLPHAGSTSCATPPTTSPRPSTPTPRRPPPPREYSPDERRTSDPVEHRPSGCRKAAASTADRAVRFTVDGTDLHRAPRRHRRLGAAGQRTSSKSAPSIYRGRPRGIVAAGVEEPNALLQVGGRLLGAHGAGHHSLELFDGLSASDPVRASAALDPAARPRGLRQDVRAHRRPGRSAPDRPVSRLPLTAAAVRRPRHPARRTARARRLAALRPSRTVGDAARARLGRRIAVGELDACPEVTRAARDTAPSAVYDDNYVCAAAAHRPPRRRRPTHGRLPTAAVAHPGPPGRLATGAHERPLVFARQRPARGDARRRRAHLPQPLRRHRRLAGRGRHHQRQRLRHVADLVAAGIDVAVVVDARADAVRPGRARSAATRGAGPARASVVVDTDGDQRVSPASPASIDADGQLAGDRTVLSTATCSRSQAGGARSCTCTASARASCAGTTRWPPSSPPAPVGTSRSSARPRGSSTSTAVSAEGAVPEPTPRRPPASRRRRPRPDAAVRGSGGRAGPARAALAGARVATATPADWDDHFVDLQRDQTVADVLAGHRRRDAQRRARQALHLDRHRARPGQDVRVNAIGVIAAALGGRARRPEQVGTTTYRAPYTPVAVRRTRRP